MSDKEHLNDLFKSVKNEDQRLALLLPQIEQAILYANKRDVRFLLNQIKFEQLDKFISRERVIRLMSIKSMLTASSNSSLIDIEMADYIYREEVIPSCYQYGPFGLRWSDKLVNKCGYVLINDKDSKVAFVSKERNDLGIIPIKVYKKSLQEIENNRDFSEQKFELLRTMIYCLKSHTKRYYCTRGSQVKKSEPPNWFKKINKGKIRQKYWYYYDSKYYTPTIENWPYSDLDSKLSGNRIWN